jgi:stage II sporulation protein D
MPFNGRHNLGTTFKTNSMKILYALLLMLIYVSIPTNALAEEMVTVKLVNYVKDTSTISVSIKGNYTSLSPTLTLEEGVNYTLTVKQGEFYLSTEEEQVKIPGNFSLIPETYNEQQLIYINERPYLGAMEFTIEEQKFIRPINQLPMEDYLKGVVPNEVYPSWDIDALKAQSLAARTYAVMHANGKKMMNDTIQFQVYGGYSKFAKTNNAVEETRGEIITYNDKPIYAFYSASNGGMTESNANVWGGNPREYYPIKEDQYDPEQPWSFSFQSTQIELDDLLLLSPDKWYAVEEKDKEIMNNVSNWLKRKGYMNPRVLSIPQFELDDQKTPSKRLEKGSITIMFIHQLLDGMVYFDQISLQDVPLAKIRPLIGGTIFKSYLIDSLEYNDGVYTLKGRGYGHGVGMSQWGANEMALAGKTYKQIISFYYPQTKIKKAYQ